MLERIPAAAFGEPADVAAAVLYLAGDGGRYVTGQTLHVNGGLYMG
jgi:3-oxoacyl-[acyl-carrier protein] reductase